MAVIETPEPPQVTRLEVTAVEDSEDSTYRRKLKDGLSRLEFSTTTTGFVALHDVHSAIESFINQLDAP